ncbi:MAG: M14 family zinc carboxypeptidase [Gemmatimonadaceae bacterium]
MRQRHAMHGWIFLLASIAGTGSLDAQGAPAVPAAAPAKPATSSSLPTARVTYRTLTETNLELERIAAANPDRVRRFALPHKSLLGQTVWALEITRNVNVSSGKPVFLMTGLHHSREWPTVELTMEFVHDVLKNDGVDPRITALLDSVRFLVVPVVNPDGYELSRSLLNEQKRKSCRLEAGQAPTFADCANPANVGAGVDLNRNYGAFWGGSGANVGPAQQSYRGAAPFSEPEIQNMRDLMAGNQVVVALSNHTPDAKVLRVPSAAEEPVPADDSLYDALAQQLGGDLKWQAGPWPKVYYVANGTMEEQAYYSAGTLAFTFENTPGQRSFHPAYSFVVDQYSGTGAYPGSSARAGFLRLYEAAANPRLHAVLRVKAPAGARLTLEKHFLLETAPVLQADNARGPALTLPTLLTSSLTVPKGSTEVTWHVNPSLRPSQHDSSLLDESWTITCRLGGKSRKATVKVARGHVAVVDLSRCAAASAAGRDKRP